MKIIATNKKANFDYQISLKLDAGIVLTGSEVKSLRNNSSSIKESYIENEGGELWLCNCHIKKYDSSHEKDHNPTRKRKLLLNKKEINKLIGKIQRDGLTIVPTKMYFKKGKAKLELAVAKGKKQFDKRASKKNRDWSRDKARYIRKSS